MGSGGVDESDREGIPDGTDFFHAAIIDRDETIYREPRISFLARARKSSRASRVWPPARFMGASSTKEETHRGIQGDRYSRTLENG